MLNYISMASIKVKFRASTVTGREGTIYYQVIHNFTALQYNNFSFIYTRIL